MRNDLENSPGIEAIVSAVDHFIADRGLSDQAIVGHLDTNALWNELKVFESSQWLVVIIRFYPTPFNHSLIFRLPDWWVTFDLDDLKRCFDYLPNSFTFILKGIVFWGRSLDLDVFDWYKHTFVGTDPRLLEHLNDCCGGKGGYQRKHPIVDAHLEDAGISQLAMRTLRHRFRVAGMKVLPE
ncbi:MAG: hypothetical protein IPP17_06750 [Bacteroidetes bacterium]|nr:hypothetical protein [Bacteroidota bacterium]